MPDFLGTRAIRGHNSAVSPRTLKTRAFTVIELVVITAIIAVISGLILLSNSNFGGKVLLENLAYDIALTVRQAQVYGISVQRFGTNFTAGYGMHFDTSSGSRYSTFADAVTVNGLYDCPTPGSALTCELVQSTDIERGFKIYKLCAPAGNDSGTCTSVNPLDITFKRPEPDACFSVGGVSDLNASQNCKDTYQNVRIVVRSPRGDIDSIVVEANGQITVQKK